MSCTDPNCGMSECIQARMEKLKLKEAEEKTKAESEKFRRIKPIVLYRLYMYNPGTNNTFLMDFEYNILHTERDLRKNEATWQRSPSPTGAIFRPQRLEFYYNSIDDLLEKIPELEIRDNY